MIRKVGRVGIMFHDSDDLMMVTLWTETARLIVLYRVLSHSRNNSEITVVFKHQAKTMDLE